MTPPPPGDGGPAQPAGSPGPAAPGAIVLIGMMGSGKSEVGRVLAERLGCDYCDLDQVIEAGAGRSVATIFAEEGESGFRRREAAVVNDTAAAVRAGVGPGVIAGGGGVVLDPANAEALRGAGTVVWLQVTPAVAAARLGSGEGRPVLAAMDGSLEERIAALAAGREGAYRAAAHHAIDAGGSPEQVATTVLALVSP